MKSLKKLENPTKANCLNQFLLKGKVLSVFLGKNIYAKIADVMEDAAAKENSFWIRQKEDGKTRFVCNVCNNESVVARKCCPVCGATKIDDDGKVRVQ